MLAFGRSLPAIRDRTEADLRRPGLPREKVLAVIVRLLERSFIRVGNEEYARQNRSFGLTTLRDRHVAVKGGRIRFNFRGKSGIAHTVGLRDRRLARIVKRCQELPGQELFQYEGPNGDRGSIDSGDVNDYLREITGQTFTAKDFRTWAGTVLAYRALRALEPADGRKAARRNVVEAMKQVAGKLGNTPVVARRSYVHPAVLDAYLDASMTHALATAAEDQSTPPRVADEAEEAAVLDLLRQRLVEPPAASRAGDRRE